MAELKEIEVGTPRNRGKSAYRRVLCLKQRRFRSGCRQQTGASSSRKRLDVSTQMWATEDRAALKRLAVKLVTCLTHTRTYTRTHARMRIRTHARTPAHANTCREANPPINPFRLRTTEHKSPTSQH
ncbi:hypothetical protein EVAR_62691_1 [Eumeta japonica]|uniref:Uncharacterized protein n=1 Tax=Eumeta variegata TaxID=151549 RepID=A0A4C1ZXH2_EUMVA|nr:hypothetical protein EVAR_62691_1 [Eumeta japonica]